MLPLAIHARGGWKEGCWMNRRLIKSVGFAAQGILFTLKTQANARIHLAFAIIVCVLGFGLHIRADDWRWLAVCIALVWFSELMNTAFEHLCDVVRPELHDSVKKAKDIAAGAVLICVLGAAVIGGLVFWPYVNGHKF